MLALLFLLLTADPRVEIVSANDTTVVYRERLPPQAVKDPATGTTKLEPTGTATRTVQRKPRDPNVVSVLFLGNSLTYFNETPRMTTLLGAKETRPLRTGSVTISGATLEQLWTESPAPAKLWQEHWDYVVVQEQSSTHRNVPRFEKYLQIFADEARRSGATPLLFMSWTAPEKVFLTAAKKTNVRVVPIGVAWRALIASGAFKRLDWDGLHPNLYGSYLIACSVYATVYGKSPVGVRHTVPKTLADADEEYDAALVQQTISPEQALQIQRAAWAAVQKFLPAH
ncbi:MAG TPA: hypothetical protein VGF69_00005 [Thermoanaerobaculia bacterium]|jgi:hypothetical protein